MTQPIVKKVLVACGSAQAFDVFTREIATWWPLARHTASAGQGQAAQAITIEPHVGGAVYETMFDGTRDSWGEVVDWQQGTRFAMTWHPGSNKAHPTRVEVRFDEMPDGQTQVTLTHSGWEAWADQADDKRGTYASGWVHVFEECFAGAAQAS